MKKASKPRSAAQIAAQHKAAAASAKARKAKGGGANNASADKKSSASSKSTPMRNHDAPGKVTVSMMGGKYVGTGKTKLEAHLRAKDKINAYTARAYGIKGGDRAYHSEQMRTGRRIEQGKQKNAQGKTGPTALGSRRHSVGGVESTGTRTQRKRAFRARTGKPQPAARPGKIVRRIK